MLGSSVLVPLALAAAVAGLDQKVLDDARTGSRRHTAIDGTPFPPLIEATLDDLVAGLERGLFSSVDLVDAYAARILEVNPTLHAVTEVNPDARAIAARLDEQRRRGEVRGPLHGVPILIKNNIATGDGMNNTAGSFALLGSRVPGDSTVAARLREAGAVILGKTNLSQWSSSRGHNISNGWSAHGGQTQAAYYPGQDPSGSSSGSAVASALGLALASLGTETAGSILLPCDVNNLAGIKPTVGLTSRHLVVPVSEHQDTVGPMARTVKDAAYLLSAIAGADPRDNYTSAIPPGAVPRYEEACDASALEGKRIGVPRNMMDIGSAPHRAPILAAFDDALEVLRQAGATVVDGITLPGYDLFLPDPGLGIVLRADLVTDLERYLAQLTRNPHNITGLASLRDFTRSFPAEGYPERDTAVFDAALAQGYGNGAPRFWAHYTRNRLYGGPLGVTGALANHSLDALVVPTAYAAALPALIGSPVVTVPLGRFPDGTPVVPDAATGTLNATAPNVPFGLSFLGGHFDEYNLVGYAYAFEQRTRAREKVVPYLQPVAEVRDVVLRRRRAGGAPWGVWLARDARCLTSCRSAVPGR